MQNTLHKIDLLSRISLFAALGLAIFLLAGCAYTYTATSEIRSSNMELREHIAYKWTTPAGIKRYTGPQNAQEIMKALDKSYDRGRSKIEVSVIRKVAGIKTVDYSSKLTMGEIDARYPRAEWLQMLLDRGIIIESFNGYVHYMLKRHTLALLEDNPDLRQSGILDLPPTDDWETYKEAYINQLVKDHTKNREIVEQIERSKEEAERAIEHSKKEVERVKAQLERSKEQTQLAIEHSKKEVERVKTQLERSKKQVEHSQKELSSHHFEHAKRQLEHVKKQINVQKELYSQQLEHAQKQLEHAQRQLEHARKQIEHIQGTLEHHFKKPMPPKAPTPPRVPTPPQAPN